MANLYDLISVNMQVFNLEKFLIDSIGLMLNQGYDNFEFIINNELRDNSLSIIQELELFREKIRDLYIL